MHKNYYYNNELDVNSFFENKEFQRILNLSIAQQETQTQEEPLSLEQDDMGVNQVVQLITKLNSSIEKQVINATQVVQSLIEIRNLYSKLLTISDEESYI